MIPTTQAPTPTNRSRPVSRPTRAVVLVAVATFLMACSQAADNSEPTATSQTTRVPTPTDAPSEPVPASSSAPATAEASDPVASVERADLALFDYEPDGPVEVTDIGTREYNGIQVRDITFDSPLGGAVPAFIAEPLSDPANVGIVMVPGMPEQRDAYLQPITEFACGGATAIVIDPPWTRDPERNMDSAFTFTETDWDEQVQLVVDARRAVDLLEEMGMEAIGFDAISYGASIGAQLAAVEDRIDAFVLLAASPGVVARFTDNGNPVSMLAMSTDDAAAREWLDLMAPLEPILFVGDATAPLLFVNGREDTIVTPEEGEAMHAAAGPDAEVRWYDSGHDLPAEAFSDQFRWIAEQLGLDPDRLAGCFDPSAL